MCCLQGRSCTFLLAEQSSLSGVSLTLFHCSHALASFAHSSRLSTALVMSSHLSRQISLSWQGLPPLLERVADSLCLLALDSAFQVSFGSCKTGFCWHSISPWFPLPVVPRRGRTDCLSRVAAKASTLRLAVLKLSLLLNQTGKCLT